MEMSKVLQLFGPMQEEGSGFPPTKHEIVMEIEKRHLELLFAAMSAEAWSFSHRQCSPDRHRTRMGRYGAAVLGSRSAIRQEDRFVVTTGWNFKLRPGNGRLIQYHPSDDYKLCAEPEPVLEAMRLRCEVSALYLFSDNMQKEDVSRKFSHIQHPCSDCREFLLRHVKSHTPVVVARHRLPCDLDPNANYLKADGSVSDFRCFTPGDLVYEQRTFGWIMQYHNYKTGRRE